MAGLALATAPILCLLATSSLGQPTAGDPTAAGKAVYQRANCVGCHKWHGGGGGGYGGSALSLRGTQLTREQIIETVTCGRPGTGMPYHLRGAYDTTPCYGFNRADMTGMMPPEATAFLRPADIEQVTDYVLANVKGKGDPTLDECITFFGDGSRVCNIYKDPGYKDSGSASSGAGH